MSPHPTLEMEQIGTLPTTHSINHALDRNSTHSSQRSTNDMDAMSAGEEALKSAAAAGPPPPPNGGTRAWLHVVGGFMLQFNSWGILNAFGVFQTYYESGQLFKESSSAISWIGAIQSCMLLAIGFVAGPFYDRGYLRTLLLVGTFGVVFGHMMLSISSTYWEVLLAQGLCVGLGAGCLFLAGVSVLPSYFSTKIGLAIGLASSGSSLGGVIYPIVLYRLIDRVGFGWSVRVIGFIALGTLLVPIAVMKMRFKPAKARAFIDQTAFTDTAYLLFILATLIGFIGLGVILFYLSYFTQSQHLGGSKIAFYIVPIFNAASCFGRTIPNAISDKIGPFNLLAPCALVTGIIAFSILAVTAEAGIIAVAVFAGAFSGVYVAMPPVCFVALTKDKSKLGTRIGMGFGTISLGMLAAGPAAGAILGTGEGLEWTGLWAFAGATATLSGIMYVAIRVKRTGWRINVRG